METNNNQEIITAFENAASELIKMLSSFSEVQFNKIPFEGSWTAAQVGEHLRKSYNGIPQTLTGTSKQTERDPRQFIEPIKTTFLNFNTKLQSPDFIIPEQKQYKKDELIHSLEAILKEIIKTLPALDMNATCTSFSFPVLGELTGVEIVHFITYHTQRHIHQLKNIKQKIEATAY